MLSYSRMDSFYDILSWLFRVIWKMVNLLYFVIFIFIVILNRNPALSRMWLRQCWVPVKCCRTRAAGWIRPMIFYRDSLQYFLFRIYLAEWFGRWWNFCILWSLSYRDSQSWMSNLWFRRLQDILFRFSESSIYIWSSDLEDDETFVFHDLYFYRDSQSWMSHSKISDGFVVYRIFCFDFQNRVYIFGRVIWKIVQLLYFMIFIFIVIPNLGCRISGRFVVYRILVSIFRVEYIYLTEWIGRWWIFVFLYLIEILTCAISNVIAPLLSAGWIFAFT